LFWSDWLSFNRAKFNRVALAGTMLTVISVAGGCSSIDRLSQLASSRNSRPSKSDDATGYKPVQMPMPKPEAVSYNANRCGATARGRSSRISAPTRSATS